MSVTVEQRRRETRFEARSWWRDGLEAAVYLVSAAGVALVIASGGAIFAEPADVAYFLGRAFGVVATVFALTQVLLVSRAPFIERAVGHDRLVVLHTKLGKWAIILMLGHMALLVSVSAYYDGRNVLGQAAAFFTDAWYLAFAQVALALFLMVLVTSLLVVRSKWRYESWHAVHALVYLAIGFAVPHQFLFGSTFLTNKLAWWFWLTLYVLAFGTLLVFRVIRPVARWRKNGLQVAEVTPIGADAVSIVMVGRGVGKLAAKPGQFFLWRFLAPGLWSQAHPYSLSSAPQGASLRITVKASGDFSAALASLKPGTQVVAEGPLGVFHDDARYHSGVVLVAAGIGITPVRAMLEAHQGDGPCDVIVRVRSEQEAPLLDEVRDLAKARGAELHVLVGARGAGWAPAGQPVGLIDLVPDLAQRDVFVCGPREWAQAVEADALAAGSSRFAIHRERFEW